MSEDSEDEDFIDPHVWQRVPVMNGGRKEYHYGNVFTGKMLRFLPEQELGKNYSDKEIAAFKEVKKNAAKTNKRGDIDTFCTNKLVLLKHRHRRKDCGARRGLFRCEAGISGIEEGCGRTFYE